MKRQGPMALLAVLLALGSTPVFACSVLPALVRIPCELRPVVYEKSRCLNGECTVHTELDPRGRTQVVVENSDARLYVEDRTLGGGLALELYPVEQVHAPDALEAIEAACVDDLTDFRPLFSEAMAVDSHPEFRLYASPEEAIKAQARVQSSISVSTCVYDTPLRAGSWLAVVQRVRPYSDDYKKLSLSESNCGPEYVTRISPFKFLGFLLTHPSRATLPHLIPYLVVLGPAVALLIQLGRRGEFRRFWTPGIINVGIAVLFTLILACMMNPREILWWPPIGYFFGSALQWWQRRTGAW